MNHSERNISLVGKSGTEYYGKMYSDKNSHTSLTGKVIVCLGNTRWRDNHWQHDISDIYNDDAFQAIRHFNEREDVSHIILIPEESTELQSPDIIDDLRKRYIHK